MRLLIVSINFDPEVIGVAAYSTGVAEYLAKNGDQVDVVTALPYYPGWRTFDGWRRPFWKFRRSSAGVRIVHCPIYVPSNPSGVKRILHHISFAITAFPVLLWRCLFHRPDVVFVVAPSLISAPLARFSALLSGAKTWLHVQDFEVEAAFATGLLNSGTRVGRIALGFERWILRRFHVVSSISEPMLAKLVEKGVAAANTIELRNWANIANVTPIEGRSPLRDELDIDTEFVALYSGNLANKQGLEIIPQAARILSHRDDLTFVICGEGPMRKPLEEMTPENAKIRFFPLQPLDRLSALLGMADVHLLPQIADAADLVLPSKLTNMLASGRAVIATASAGSALAEEVDGAGVVVPPGDAVALATELEALLDDPARRSELGQCARQRALARWDMAAILSRFRMELGQLIGLQVKSVIREPQELEENS